MEVSSDQSMGRGAFTDRLGIPGEGEEPLNYMNTQSSYVNNYAAKIYWTYSTIIIMEVLAPFTL